MQLQAEPNIGINGTFSWSVIEGQGQLVALTGNDFRAHLEIRSQATVGQRFRVKVETSIPIDNYSISQYLNFYITSNYRIAKSSEGVLSIERKNPANSTYSLLATNNVFEYQIIDSRTNNILLSGYYPVDKELNLNVSDLGSGVYTVISLITFAIALPNRKVQ